MTSTRMSRSGSCLLIVLACALGSSGCSGSCSDAPTGGEQESVADAGAAAPVAPVLNPPAQPSVKPAAKIPTEGPPAPNFDPEALVGRWKTVVPASESAPEVRVDARYTAGRFVLRMAVGGDTSVEVSGAWTIEGDDLIETPEKSDLPFWTVGVATRSKILILDPKQFIFERGDSLMRYVRAGS